MNNTASSSMLPLRASARRRQGDAPAAAGQVVQHHEEQRPERDRQIEDERHEVRMIEQRRGVRHAGLRTVPGNAPGNRHEQAEHDHAPAPPVPSGASRRLGPKWRGWGIAWRLMLVPDQTSAVPVSGYAEPLKLCTGLPIYGHLYLSRSASGTSSAFASWLRCNALT